MDKLCFWRAREDRGFKTKLCDTVCRRCEFWAILNLIDLHMHKSHSLAMETLVCMDTLHHTLPTWTRWPQRDWSLHSSTQPALFAAPQGEKKCMHDTLSPYTTVNRTCRAALLTGRYQTRSGIYPGVFYPDSIGGTYTVPAIATADCTD